MKWDFDKGRIKFGNRDWVALVQEPGQPCRTSMIRKNLSIADRGGGRQRRGIDFDRPDFHDAPTGFARRFCRPRSDQKSLRGVWLFHHAVFLMENERERGKTSEPGA